MASVLRQNLEAECLMAFDQVVFELGCATACRGQGLSNQFVPNFGLDCQTAGLAAALSEHGVDVTTTNAAGRTGATDDLPTKAGCVIVSNNIADFAALHPGAAQRLSAAQSPGK